MQENFEVRTWAPSDGTRNPPAFATPRLPEGGFFNSV